MHTTQIRKCTSQDCALRRDQSPPTKLLEDRPLCYCGVAARTQTISSASFPKGRDDGPRLSKDYNKDCSYANTKVLKATIHAVIPDMYCKPCVMKNMTCQTTTPPAHHKSEEGSLDNETQTVETRLITAEELGSLYKGNGDEVNIVSGLVASIPTSPNVLVTSVVGTSVARPSVVGPSIVGASAVGPSGAPALNPSWFKPGPCCCKPDPCCCKPDPCFCKPDQGFQVTNKSSCCTRSVKSQSEVGYGRPEEAPTPIKEKSDVVIDNGQKQQGYYPETTRYVSNGLETSPQRRTERTKHEMCGRCQRSAECSQTETRENACQCQCSLTDQNTQVKWEEEEDEEEENSTKCAKKRKEKHEKRHDKSKNHRKKGCVIQ